VIGGTGFKSEKLAKFAAATVGDQFISCSTI
jgi:hypothetical protein